MAVFDEPLALSAGDVFLTASIGVAALAAGSGATASDLIRHADTAMYRAKSVGRNCVAVSTSRCTPGPRTGSSWKRLCTAALDRRELQLYHQPILNLRTGTVTGFEALMRWRREDGSIVSPAEFIPIAEDNGMIIAVGSWALLEATSQLRRWIDGRHVPARLDDVGERVTEAIGGRGLPWGRPRGAPPFRPAGEEPLAGSDRVDDDRRS